MSGPAQPGGLAPDGATGGPPQQREPVVDFDRMGWRLRRTAAALGALVAGGWLLSLPLHGGDLALLGNLGGLALAVLFVAEVVIVGGSAMRGMLSAGERGDRLAAGDVGLLPPQLSRRLRGGRQPGE